MTTQIDSGMIVTPELPFMESFPIWRHVKLPPGTPRYEFVVWEYVGVLGVRNPQPQIVQTVEDDGKTIKYVCTMFGHFVKKEAV